MEKAQKNFTQSLICRYYLKQVAKVNWKKNLCRLTFIFDFDVILSCTFFIEKSTK